MAVGDGFHVDSSGNLWLGSTRETFDATTRSEAPFYVYADGSIVANSGTFSGDISGASGTFTGDLSGADISGGTINIGNGTFQVDSSGNMTATSATLSGYLAAGSDFDDLDESGSIVGWVLDSNSGRLVGQNSSGQYIYLDSSGNIAGNYTQGSAGWAIYADGTAEFQDIIARGTISGTVDTNLFVGSGGNFKSSSGTSRVEVQGSNPASLFFIKSSSTTGAITAGADEFTIQSYTGDTLTLNAGVGQTDTLNLNAGTLAIKAGTDITTTSGTTITISGSSGTAGQVLQSNANGISWEDGTGHSHGNLSFPNAGTVLSSSNHSHGTPLTSNHENAANPHDNYLQESDHNANNTAHSNFITNADLSNHVTNSNANFLSAVGHTAMAAGNLGVAHGLDLSNVLNSSNNGGGTTHSHGNIHNHTGTVLTTAGAGNLYSEPHNNHSHNHSQYGTGNSNWGSSDTDNNSKVSTAYSHSQSAHSSHNHTGTVLTTAGADNLYSTPHNSHSHNHSSYVTNSTYGSHLDNLHFSDSRLKTNIIDTSFGLAYLNSLRPVDYEFTELTLDTYYDDEIHTNMRSKFEGIRHGFIAQEVRTATVTNHSSENAFGGLGYKTPTDLDNYENIQTFDAEQLVGPMVKAIQELSAKIDLLESRVEELEGV